MAVYLKNKNLLKEYHRSIERGELTPEMVKMFQLLVSRISWKFKYLNPQDRQDTEGQALYQLCRAWYKFDPERSDNPFAYYTQVAKMGFAQGWNQLHNSKMAGKLMSLDRTGPNGENSSGTI